MITISVVIPCFGNAELKVALDSVAGQTERPDELILVIDDPGNPQLDSQIAELREFGFPTRVIRNAENLGIVSSCLMATNMAKSEYILFLDMDDRLGPDALKSIRLALANSPQKPIAVYTDRNDLVGKKSLRRSSSGVLWYSTLGAALFEHTFLSHAKVLAKDFLIECQTPTSVEGFQDWWWALQAAALRSGGLVWIPEPHYEHTIHANQLSNRHHSDLMSRLNLQRNSYKLPEFRKCIDLSKVDLSRILELAQPLIRASINFCIVISDSRVAVKPVYSVHSLSSLANLAEVTNLLIVQFDLLNLAELQATQHSSTGIYLLCGSQLPGTLDLACWSSPFVDGVICWEWISLTRLTVMNSHNIIFHDSIRFPSPRRKPLRVLLSWIAQTLYTRHRLGVNQLLPLGTERRERLYRFIFPHGHS